VRAGRHDYDLMVRFRLGRDELQNLLEQLVRLGHLSAEEVEARKPRKIKQCPHCHSQIFDDANQCKQCRRKLIQPVSSVPTTGPGVKVPEIATEIISSDEGCAWDDYWKNWGSRGPFSAYFHTAAQCLRSPSHFFSNLPVDFGYSAPIFFGAISGATPIAFYLVLFMFRTDRVAIGDVGLLIFMIPIALLIGVIYACASIFTSSLFIHGSLILVRGAHSGFQATFRSMSYSSLPWLFGVIPVVGWLVGNLWGLYLCGVGLRKTHDTSRTKAFSAVLIWFFFNVAVLAMLGERKPWMHW
jgi:hypothetical protein